MNTLEFFLYGISLATIGLIGFKFPITLEGNNKGSIIFVHLRSFLAAGVAVLSFQYFWSIQNTHFIWAGMLMWVLCSLSSHWASEKEKTHVPAILNEPHVKLRSDERAG